MYFSVSKNEGGLKDFIELSTLGMIDCPGNYGLLTLFDLKTYKSTLLICYEKRKLIKYRKIINLIKWISLNPFFIIQPDLIGIALPEDFGYDPSIHFFVKTGEILGISQETLGIDPPSVMALVTAPFRLGQSFIIANLQTQFAVNYLINRQPKILSNEIKEKCTLIRNNIMASLLGLARVNKVTVESGKYYGVWTTSVLIGRKEIYEDIHNMSPELPKKSIEEILLMIQQNENLRKSLFGRVLRGAESFNERLNEIIRKLTECISDSDLVFIEISEQMNFLDFALYLLSALDLSLPKTYFLVTPQSLYSYQLINYYIKKILREEIKRKIKEAVNWKLTSGSDPHIHKALLTHIIKREKAKKITAFVAGSTVESMITALVTKQNNGKTYVWMP